MPNHVRPLIKIKLTGHWAGHRNFPIDYVLTNFNDIIQAEPSYYAFRKHPQQRHVFILGVGDLAKPGTKVIMVWEHRFRQHHIPLVVVYLNKWYYAGIYHSTTEQTRDSKWYTRRTVHLFWKIAQ